MPVLRTGFWQSIAERVASLYMKASIIQPIIQRILPDSATNPRQFPASAVPMTSSYLTLWTSTFNPSHERSSTMTTLIYIADPMCSWCYGFGPELAALMQGLPELPVEVVVGGLRPYNTQSMDESLKTTLLAHWHKVAEKTGLPFMDDALTREGFVYDTEPACRAVVAARKLAPAAALAVFQAIQHAFYAAGLDVTRTDVLSEIGATTLTKLGFPTDAAAFESMLTSEDAIKATHDDFMLTQKWGVNGFPTLVLEREGRLDLVTSGYVEMPLLVEQMQAIIDKPA
jgi:putative protein-disulfide isomerase